MGLPNFGFGTSNVSFEVEERCLTQPREFCFASKNVVFLLKYRWLVMCFFLNIYDSIFSYLATDVIIVTHFDSKCEQSE